MKWYSKSFRRHLCDMHIEDWHEDFLSKFSAENYFNKLIEAEVQSAMIYFQSHVGYCYYPTKSGKIHNAFVGREDEMLKLVKMCRKAGIYVTGYYSLIYNTWAADEFPHWQMVRSDGKTDRDMNIRYGRCCPNNPEYREFVFKQIEEMADYFEVDGMFYDMPFYPYFCTCEHCKKRWKEETGTTFPTESLTNVRGAEDIYRKWVGEFSLAVTEKTRELMPGVSVQQNYAYGALPYCGIMISEKTNDASDYAGGDLHSSLYVQSFACKYYQAVTRNQPFEYMISRCNPNLENHTVTKTKNMLEQQIMLTCANHGASLVIDAIDPDGEMDGKIYSLLKEVYAEEKKYEPYLKGEMLCDVGVLYSFSSKKNLQGHTFNNYTGSLNSVIAMVENHIPVGIIPTENMKSLDKYKFIILSNPNHLSDEIQKSVIEYVKNGGALYFSNTDESEMLYELIGAKRIDSTKEYLTYVAPKPGYEELLWGYTQKSPLPFPYRLEIIDGIDKEDVVATISLPYTHPDERRFASIHSDPPGISTDLPAMVIKSYGKGTVIWSAAPIENEPVYDYKQIMCNLVRKYINGEVIIETDAPATVELVSFCDKEDNVIRISVVSLYESDYPLIYSEFNVNIKVDIPVKSVKLISDEMEIPFTYKNGFVSFYTRKLDIFDMYEISFA